MISMSEYLENIYVDFASDINEQTKLCQLKGLNFAAGCLPDYNNLQIQRLYLLRYSFAYGFEYSGIYSEVLARLHNPQKVCVASIGCGNFLDYWSLVQSIEKKNLECEVRYVGIDEIDWNYKFDKRDGDELYFKKGNAINFFEENKEFISDIYFFPKSISEFDAKEMNVMVNNLQNKPILRDKLIFCFSIRANEGSRERDMEKTEQIIGALKRNGFHLNNPTYGYTFYRENKGIIAYDNSYVYPQEAYDYIVSLNEKCGSYIKNGANCGEDCIQYLNRKPTTKTGNIYYRINAHQVSKIDITPEVVDCIVFWTKNPEPMLNRLDELSSYDYYFQFTLTGYGKDMECNVPHKKDRMIPVFQELSQKIGMKKVIWRYDPIIFTKKYTPEYHLKAFEQIATALKGYTEKCVISFVDVYAKNKKNMELLDSYEVDKNELLKFAKKIADIAMRNGMAIGSCAERVDLDGCGIKHNSCIDKTLIEDIIGCRLKVEKDKNQRGECGCMESVEIGTYNTCKNGCKYCYANYSQESVVKNCGKYDPKSPILCGILDKNDKITERKVKSLKEQQLSIFDL